MRIINAVRDIKTMGRLLPEAEAEARRAGEERPGPEHLVLAAAALPDGTAAKALGRVGTDAQRLRSAIDAAHEKGLAAVGIDVDGAAPGTTVLRAPARGIMRSTPQAQEVFQGAVALSKAAKPSYLQGAHVVAAACELERGTFIRALDELGIDRDALRAAALAELAAG
jgi:ATP-dependent Clp protease ATP-binding subunit ClpA